MVQIEFETALSLAADAGNMNMKSFYSLLYESEAKSDF